jgi:hypothetical protein
MNEATTEPDEAAAERIVSEADLAVLNTEWQRAASRAGDFQARAEAEARGAAELAAVKDWLAPRVGQSWEALLAEAEAGLAEAAAAVAETSEALRQAQEWHRDVIGYGRCLERRAAELAVTPEQARAGRLRA